MSVCPCLCLCLCLSISVLSLSACLHACLSVSFWMSECLSVCTSLSLYLGLPVSMSAPLLVSAFASENVSRDICLSRSYFQYEEQCRHQQTIIWNIDRPDFRKCLGAPKFQTVGMRPGLNAQIITNEDAEDKRVGPKVSRPLPLPPRFYTVDISTLQVQYFTPMSCPRRLRPPLYVLRRGQSAFYRRCCLGNFIPAQVAWFAERSTPTPPDP